MDSTNKRSAEEIYQKLDLRSQILVRPDTYTGSVEPETRDEWVWVSLAKTPSCPPPNDPNDIQGEDEVVSPISSSTDKVSTPQTSTVVSSDSGEGEGLDKAPTVVQTGVNGEKVDVVPQDDLSGKIQLPLQNDQPFGSLIKRKVTISPAMLKIFDEVLVNASDHKQRDSTMKKVDVEINQATGCISVLNDGDNGVPVRMHEKEQLWIPEMIFAHLLTSSNYNDQEKRTTGGKNGMYFTSLCLYP